MSVLRESSPSAIYSFVVADTRCLLVVAIMLWFLFPDSPVDARFFTADEKVLAVKRVAESKVGVKNKQFKWYQVRPSLASRWGPGAHSPKM